MNGIGTKSRLRELLTLAVSGAAICAGTAAVGAEASPTSVQEVIVTAQKIAQPLSKVPLTISALNGDQIRDRNYQSLEDFKGLVPGLNVSNYAGEARINVRGIGMNSLSFGVDSQVAFSLNGVYVSSARAADQALLDIDRIEVVRGPQGTLYGRNATGGALNVITNAPTENFEGYAQLRYGNYNDIASQLVVSGPLVGDRVLGRLAFATEDHDGYSLNLFDGKHYDDAHTQTVRGSLRVKFSPNLTLDVVADYTHVNDGGNAVHLFGQSPGFPVMTGLVLGGTTVPLDANGQSINPRLMSVNTLPENIQNMGGVSATLNWRLNDQFTLRSISAYRKERIALTMDFDESTAVFPSLVPGKDFEAYEGDEQFSQELQFIGHTSRIDVVAGLYYLHDYVDPAFFTLGINFGVPSFPFIVPIQLGGTTTTNAYAAFGQVTFKVTDRLHFTAGLRESYEERSATLLELVPSFGVTVRDAKSANFQDLSPKFSVDYQWTDGLMTFATIAKGFQSGGFDVSAQPPLIAFQPETVWDYEAGIKYRGHGLSLDLSGFHYDYANLQVAQIVNGLPATTNAATSKINGAEVSATARLAQGLSITETFAYTDAYFTKFVETDTLTGLPTNLAGNQLPGAPRYSNNLTLAYEMPIGANRLSLLGEWNWHDRLYFTEFNSDQISQPPVSTFNASARYTFDHDHVSVELFAKNISNQLIRSQVWITGAGFGSMAIGQLAPPRTFGATLRYSFR